MYYANQPHSAQRFLFKMETICDYLAAGRIDKDYQRVIIDSIVTRKNTPKK